MRPTRFPLPTMALLALAVALATTAVARHSYTTITFPVPGERADEEVRRMYEAWKSKHGRPHSNCDMAGDEDRLRLEVFRDNLRYIDAHNAEASAGLHTFRLGLTPFTDLTLEEYRGRALGFRGRHRGASAGSRLVGSGGARYHRRPSPRGDFDLPDSIDWRELGAVTDVKNQEQCGGCWAFSAVAAIEGINAIVTGNLVSLSEQEIIDCDTVDSGCNGGQMENAFQYVTDNGGIDTESDYPFIGTDGTCDVSKENDAKAAAIDGFMEVASNNETALQEAVATQPVSVAIDASGRPFQHYTWGVFNGPCGTNLDHGVTVVGYGSENGRDYWIVKNSWSADWGEGGYIRMRRNVPRPTGKCGIAMDASYPVKDTTYHRPATARAAAMDVLKMVLA